MGLDSRPSYGHKTAYVVFMVCVMISTNVPIVNRA